MRRILRTEEGRGGKGGGGDVSELMSIGYGDNYAVEVVFTDLRSII